MRKIWNKSSRRRSIATFHKPSADDASSIASPVPENGPTPESYVRALIRPDHDSTEVKHAWINAVLSSSSTPEFSEANLRLYRVELRGSHLYIYRPPQSMGIRSFRVDSANPLATPVANDSDAVSIAPTEQALGSSETPLTQISDQDTYTTTATKDKLPQLPVDAASTPVPSPVHLTYFKQKLPHPELKYDFDSNTFLASSSTEALVHFFLFADDHTHQQSVRCLIHVLPLFPRFGSVLDLLHTFLGAIEKGQFGTVSNPEKFADRVFGLFQHVAQNFCGFLLKPDVASQVLKILEFFSTASLLKSSPSIAQFKTEMLSKQQLLLNLVGKAESTPTVATYNPFQDLSSSTFVNDINLLDLADAITEVDAQFFASWNSSIDKSLLLLPLISETNPGESFLKKNPLLFHNDYHVHYLSRLLVHHLFLESPNITHEKRARILERWIDLGCILDKSGNMSSWLGIASIILSQPILRLTSIWAHVGGEYVKLLKNDWSPILYELDKRHLPNSYESVVGVKSTSTSSDKENAHVSKETYHIMAPRGLGKIYPKEKVVPYFGDLLLNNSQSVNVTELEAAWTNVNFSFERWNGYVSNLSNSTKIINYNEDVLRRYQSAGFVFSNDNLNQVLYLGVNKDDEKSLPPSDFGNHDDTPSMFLGENADVRAALRGRLYRLIDLNRDSISLETLMRYSLATEPASAEQYLRAGGNQNMQSYKKHARNNASSISVNSVNSFGTHDASETIDTSSIYSTKQEELSVDDKLPEFNNHYYSIDLQKYDDLTAGLRDSFELDGKHNVVVDNELVLRIDDFVNDNELTMTISANDATQLEEEDGLGIDVDDILNSEKFQNFSISNDNKFTDDKPSSDDKKHRSFGLVSNHSQRTSTVTAPKFIPKFASIDRLIDLLVIDSKYFDTAHSVDLKEYRFVFMLNYSSFMTTKELLEKLVHRFVNSGNALISIMRYELDLKADENHPRPLNFPNWEKDHSVDLPSLGEIDLHLLLDIQVNILKALIVLINNFFENFSNDLNNKKLTIQLLRLYSNEILNWYNSNKIDKALDKPFESLVSYYKRLKKLFLRKSYRPLEASKFENFLLHEFKFSDTMHDVPMNRNLPSSRNIHKIEKFINKFNKLLAVFYKGITSENWFQVFKVLENSFENFSLLNYNIQKPSTSEDAIQVSNIFDYLETLNDSAPDDPVFKKLPLVFRKLLKLHSKFRAYLMVQLCDRTISTADRLDRMKTLLLMIKISRLKMGESQFVFEGNFGIIPSCIETALTCAVYSPESRSLAHLWLKASATAESNDGLSASFDDIDSLLPSEIKQEDLLPSREPLLPCFGWIIQNLIEINRCPSFHREVINFNKRYLIYKLIKELSVEDVEDEEFHNDTREFEFLFKLKSATNFMVDEINGGKPTKRIFKSVIRTQYAILTAETRKRALRDARMPPDMTLSSSISSSQTLISKKSSNPNLRRQSLAYKTNSSSRFKISGLFNKQRGFNLNAAAERVASFRELPDPESVLDGTKQKPVMTVQLKNKKIFPVYLLPFSLKIDGDNSNESLCFQASGDVDAKDWLQKLNHANRHWFYSKTINTKQSSPFITFGMPLEIICARDATKTPRILTMLYDAIENEGLKDVGIYRISTSISELNSIKQEIDRTGSLDLGERGVDVFALTSCVKSFFREMPEAVLTDDVIEELFDLTRSQKDSAIFTDSDSEAYKRVLEGLPAVNFFTLKELLRHLNKIVQQSEHNKMPPSNLATVIGPALTEASNVESLINNFGLMNQTVEKLIVNYSAIFEAQLKHVNSGTSS